MDKQENYYILKKNNRLQTIVTLANPYVYVSQNKDEIQNVKEQLELKYLRQFPIDFHFDHTEVVCDEEMINFDKYLLEEYGFTFLKEGFDHNSKELNGKILYGKKFPEHLTDKDLFSIQKKMNKYHFELIQQEPNGKFIILLDPWRFNNPLRDRESYKLQNIFETKEEAQKLMDEIIEHEFDSYGTALIVGYIHDDELNEEAMMILNSQSDIRFKSIKEGYGQQFVSDKKLNEIENGMEILMKLLGSLDRTPYEIIELK